MRIGIDVGGTNTDAVLVSGTEVVAKIKTPTTADVTSGIVTAIEYLLSSGQVPSGSITAVMIGTTHFTNAVIERRRLARTGVLRLGLPATQAVEPFEDWPDELRSAIGAHAILLHGGNEFDGREISALDEAELLAAVDELAAAGVEAVAVSSVFSPVAPAMEKRAAALIEQAAPEMSITLSHEIGRLGLLERENAAAINAMLRPLAVATVESFRASLRDLRIDAPLYLTQNDGTIMHADLAERYPVLTFASGPTNSMRGAAFLSGLENALVLDIGGTTSDVGALVDGFPRESAVAARFADVRTNFRMPDLLSFGLGGGSIVRELGEGVTIGPDSVGCELLERGLVFGGDTLTATDVAVAAGMADLGDRSLLSLDGGTVADAVSLMRRMIEESLDRMKLNKSPEPVIIVGGGSILCGDEIEGAARVVRPTHYEVANAVGAAIAQVSGEVDKIFPLASTTRPDAIRLAREEAVRRAIAAGAEPDSTRIVDLEEIPVAYMESSMIRVRAKAVGDLAPEPTTAAR
ncbi:MAG: hydantoinase/oxoprolinase family protein [Mycolicibacterium hassiacum]|uniref:hydantoinase/oxoprolinase family protein n=1 Tax=Mycolicibacterium hassiacum TaxID=46351 RepID=UPI0023F785A4|nr:hydantoinase/oxoprolinase family protein [Mycolicibacterium hassiacum]MBX5485438.1 hydantoinase/oxoprolinase family protein [Mycolicibacterium hassiacum]